MGVLRWLTITCALMLHQTLHASQSNTMKARMATAHPTTVPLVSKTESMLYVQKLFDKYGSNGKLTFEGFEHLLASLGLGQIHIADHEIDDHFSDSGSFEEFHASHNHSVMDDLITRDEEAGHVLHDGHDSRDHNQRHNSHNITGPKYNESHHHERGTFEETVHRGHSDDQRHSKDVLGDGGHGGHNEHIEQGSGEAEGGHDYEAVGHADEDDAHGHEEDGVKETADEAVIHAEDNPVEQHEHKHADGVVHESPEMVTAAEVTEEMGYLRSKRDTGNQHLHENDGKNCMSAREILHLVNVPFQKEEPISQQTFLHLCPLMLYQIEEHVCLNKPLKTCCGQEEGDPHNHGKPGAHDHGNDSHVHAEKILSFFDIPGKVWGYASLSVTVISLVGLVCVAIIPIMQSACYNHMLQFLVSLAVGSLTGDALLHLIPHSISDPHGSDGGEEHASHNSNSVHKGLVVLGGMYGFFIMERLMSFFTDWKQSRKKMTSDFSKIGEKLSSHNDKYASCVMVHSSKDLRRMADDRQEELVELHQRDDGPDHEEDAASIHEGHSHGHSHAAPTSVSSIAWMVIMGDGLHNFTDGLAIGAAFANSIAVGLSTSIAVFCHELPHELGDFAVLLKAGMSVKQALIYNIVSSVLCFAGMVIGVAVGNFHSASQWIFAMTAGIFIYISLVDMLPEITSSPSQKNKYCHLLLQVLGMSVGVGIMLTIALYEDKIIISLDT